MANQTAEKLARAREKIIVALDVPTEDEALALVNLLKDKVGYFKVGLEFLTSAGIDIVRKIKDSGGKVFYDGKFNDIPNTTAGACRAAVRLNVDMFTVHASGGLEMMKWAEEATRTEARKLGIKAPLILGVTVLTSINQHTLKSELGVSTKLQEYVLNLARLAQQAIFGGVVSSPQEIKMLKKNLPGMKIITPGIRPAWAATQDQKRVMTPADAIAQGAYALVIGRAITQPPQEIGDPVTATNMITEEIATVLP
ncbi:orotidine-5'-phosphate decarboxylase [Chloroflexota bacterium]